MKKTVSLLLALMLTVSMLASCDDDATAPSEDDNAHAPSQTTETVVNEPVKVDDVAGMNAKQLFENIKTYMDFEKITDMEYSMNSTAMSGEQISTMRVELKLSGGKTYICTDTDGEMTEVYFVDSCVYANVQGQKVKYVDMTLEDFFGGDIADLMNSAVEKISIPSEKLDEAEIYSYRNEYYFTVSFTPEEAEQLGLARETCTVTYYFNRHGVLKKEVYDQKSLKQTAELHSVNKPVKITEPSDASEYTELVAEVGRADYQKYLSLLQTAKNAQGYYMVYLYRLSSSGMYSAQLDYQTDALGNIHMADMSGTPRTYMWCVDGKYYKEDSESNGILQVTAESDILALEEYFAAGEMYVSMALSAVPRITMRNFKYSEANGKISVSFAGGDAYYTYEYIPEDYSWQLTVQGGGTVQQFNFILNETELVQKPI